MISSFTSIYFYVLQSMTSLIHRAIYLWIRLYWKWLWVRLSKVTKGRGGWAEALSCTVYITLREVDEAAVGTNCIVASKSWNHCNNMEIQVNHFNAKLSHYLFQKRNLCIIVLSINMKSK